jgi:Protein of unknown function (DUF2690)
MILENSVPPLDKYIKSKFISAKLVREMIESLNKNKKIIVLIGVGILSVFAVLVFFAFKEVTAKPGCNTSTCIGGDPKFFKCDKVVETASINKIKDMSIELRYSPACNAGWSKASVPLGTVLYVEDINGRKFGKFLVDEAKVPGAKEYFGNMGPGKDLKACAQLKTNEVICTGFPEESVK